MMRIRSEGVAWSSAGDEVVVLDLSRSSYLGLNETATVLWHCLVDGASHASLVAALTENFDVAAERASSEVDDFLEDLRQRGYLDES